MVISENCFYQLESVKISAQNQDFGFIEDFETKWGCSGIFTKYFLNYNLQKPRLKYKKPKALLNGMLNGLGFGLFSTFLKINSLS